MATVVSGAERSRFELKTPRRGDRTPLARTSSYVPPAWCTGVGFTMSMDDTTRFDAAWGETVRWRPAAYEADLYTAPVGCGTRRTGRVTVRCVASRYGVTAYPMYQLYTDRGGYRWYSLGATTGYGYGEQAVRRCDAPWPAGY